MDSLRIVPTVSVVIPAYNASDYIRAAISSALSSQGVTLEVIVIDDGSTDDTWQILEEFGDSIEKYRVERGGPYAARNFAAARARAPWLAFLDADDEWLPTKLRSQLALASDDTAAVYTDCRNIGDTRRVKPLQSDNTQLHDGQVLRHLFHSNFISLSSALVRREWFERLGGFAERQRGVQDWDFWLRLASAGGEVRLCREPLTLYRHHAGQMTRNLDDRLHDRLAVLRHALSLPAARGMNWATVRRALANQWSIGAWNAAEQNPRLALWWYLRSASLWPFDGYVYKQLVKCVLRSVGLIHGPSRDLGQATAAT